MSAVTWREKLDSATTEHELIETVKDYVSTLEHQDISRLPVNCLPGKFFEAADVNTYAVTLLQYPRTGDAKLDALIRKLAAFFSDASARLAMLMDGGARAADARDHHPT